MIDRSETETEYLTLRYPAGEYAHAAAIYDDAWYRYDAARKAYRRCEMSDLEYIEESLREKNALARWEYDARRAFEADGGRLTHSARVADDVADLVALTSPDVLAPGDERLLNDLLARMLHEGVS